MDRHRVEIMNKTSKNIIDNVTAKNIIDNVTVKNIIDNVIAKNITMDLILIPQIKSFHKGYRDQTL